MTQPELLSTAYHLAAHPDADVFDPVAWYEGTGEDLGLPADYLAAEAKLYAKNLAAENARRTAAGRGGDPDGLYARFLEEEAGRDAAKGKKPRLALVGLGAKPADIDAFLGYLKGSSERLYDPGEPRKPKGDPEGGQWTTGGGSAGSGTSADLVKQGLAGGFSYRAFGGAPTDGFMVSPYKNAELALKVDDFTREAVIKYRTEHADLLGRPDHYFGGWLDNGFVYLDVSVRSSTLAAATALARKHHQLGIYDVGAGNTIYIDSKAA